MVALLPRLAHASQTPAAQPATASALLVATPTLAPVEAQAAAAQPAAPAAPAIQAPQPSPTQPPALAPADETIPAQPQAPAQSAEQAPPAGNLPDLNSFAASVSGGSARTVTGLYAEGQIASPVVQQPAGQGDFISDGANDLTQYARPSEYGTIALLAHNNLEGERFFQLKTGQEISVVYGDGHVARFRISDMLSYQALSPYDTASDFIDLNGPGGARLTHNQLFQRVYTTANRLVLQTCINANGDPAWGRLFVIAEPV